MIRPNFEKWQQNAAEIREKSIEAEHKRTRERFQAMYMILVFRIKSQVAEL